MEQNEQFTAMIAGTTEYRDINVRGVNGGYVIAGQRRWVDPTYGHVVATIPVETVAASSVDAADRVASFILTGDFEAPVN